MTVFICSKKIPPKGHICEKQYTNSLNGETTMITLEFNVEKPLQYCLTGKFETPSANWKHEDFPRSDYELFVVTDDVLYVNYNNVNYSVKNGQFLLIPPLPAPSNHIKGFRSSNCSFY